MDLATDNPARDDDPQDGIAELEREIAALADSAERCRKFMLAAKIAIGGGAAWLAALVLGIFPGAGSLIGATAAIIGGIVALGTNKSTLAQLLARLAAAEAARARLIGRIPLRLVHSGNDTIH
ncbi:MAG: hypothetical protein J0H62_05540 [Rhizobiales bacterium]|nr:hypothetical protein [Hyphomicrobiales bacterium]